MANMSGGTALRCLGSGSPGAITSALPPSPGISLVLHCVLFSLFSLVDPFGQSPVLDEALLQGEPIERALGSHAYGLRMLYIFV